MDILDPLPTTPRDNKFISVVSDYFAKLTISDAIPNQKAITVGEKLASEFTCHFDVPHQLHSDQGRNLSLES